MRGEARPHRAARARPLAWGGVSAQGDQGRLTPLRAELLLALPAGSAPGRGDRHGDEPSRLSLRRPCVIRASRFIIARASFSTSTYCSPETSTTACLIVPPV